MGCARSAQIGFWTVPPRRGCRNSSARRPAASAGLRRCRIAAVDSSGVASEGQTSAMEASPQVDVAPELAPKPHRDTKRRSDNRGVLRADWQSRRHGPRGLARGCRRISALRFRASSHRYLGNTVLVLFGYPEAREHDAEQAVQAGLELCMTVSTLKPCIVIRRWRRARSASWNGAEREQIQRTERQTARDCARPKRPKRPVRSGIYRRSSRPIANGPTIRVTPCAVRL
jgi:hypothetical protein